MSEACDSPQKRKTPDNDDQVVTLTASEVAELARAHETLSRLLPSLAKSSSSTDTNIGDRKEDDESVPHRMRRSSIMPEPHYREIVQGTRQYTVDGSMEHTLNWTRPVKTVLIIKKPGIEHISQALADIASFLFNEKGITVMVQPIILQHPDPIIAPLKFLQTWTKDQFHNLHDMVDFIVCLGGDGTILFTSHLFNGHVVPPVVSFAMGSLGFLTPFQMSAYKGVLTDVIHGDVPIAPRARLRVRVQRHEGKRPTKAKSSWEPQDVNLLPVITEAGDDDVPQSPEPGEEEELFHCLNEVIVSRHKSNMTDLELNIDGVFFTKVLADGMIISTPTGSTAYSLSAGGNVVHPSVPCVLLTPVCPHSLSFRPLVVPDTVTTSLLCRNKQAEVCFDGGDRLILSYGDAVTVQHSRSFVPLVCHSGISSDWHDRITHILSWNSRGGGTMISKKPVLEHVVKKQKHNHSPRKPL